MADVTQRMLALLSTLQTGRRFSGQELASRLEVSLRTVRRDVDRLRGYGYPVETRPGPAGYYRLLAGTSLPPLVLDDDEAIAVLLGLVSLASTSSVDGDGDGDDGDDDGGDDGGALDDAAARAYGKLDQFLPGRLRARAVALRTSVESGPRRAPAVSAALLADLAQAVTNRLIVRFDHLDQQGEASRRRVEPHRQIHLHQRWYLLGWDLDRSDWRVFRVDRITGLDVSGARHAPRDLPADSALAYLRQGLNIDRQRVELVVDAPLARAADAFKDQDAQLETVAHDRTHVTVWLDTWEWLVPILAFLDADVSIDAPPDFRTSLATFARRLLASTGAEEPT